MVDLYNQIKAYKDVISISSGHDILLYLGGTRGLSGMDIDVNDEMGGGKVEGPTRCEEAAVPSVTRSYAFVPPSKVCFPVMTTSYEDGNSTMEIDSGNSVEVSSVIHPPEGIPSHLTRCECSHCSADLVAFLAGMILHRSPSHKESAKDDLQIFLYLNYINFRSPSREGRDLIVYLLQHIVKSGRPLKLMVFPPSLLASSSMMDTRSGSPWTVLARYLHFVSDGSEEEQSVAHEMLPMLISTLQMHPIISVKALQGTRRFQLFL